MAASNGEMQLRAMFKAFEDGHRAKGSNPREALRDIVQSMPDLQQRMETAAEDGRLKGFAVDGKQKSAATYNSDTGIITLKSVTLADAATEQRALKRQGPNDQAPNERWSNHIRYTLSHEVQHAIDRKGLLEQDAALRGQAGALMRSGQPRDYTQLLVDYVEKSRNIEIGAEIAGFNAFADYVQDEKRKKSPGAALTLEDLYNASPSDMKMYIDVRVWESPKYQFKPDLKADESHRLRPVEENFHGMNRHFFEATNYPYTELDRGVRILREERDVLRDALRQSDPHAEGPLLLIDCARLNITSSDLPRGFVDSGSVALPLPHDVDGPSASSSGESHKRRKLMDDSPDPGPAAFVKPFPDMPAHPDHGFYTRLREKLPPELSNEVVANAMLAAKREGINSVAEVNPDFLRIAPNANTGRPEVWIVGNISAEGKRASVPADSAPSMAVITEQLEALNAERLRLGPASSSMQMQQHPAPLHM